MKPAEGTMSQKTVVSKVQEELLKQSQKAADVRGASGLCLRRAGPQPFTTNGKAK